MMDVYDPRRKRFYHGGEAGLRVGDYILSPKEVGKDNMIGLNPLHSEDRVYLTKNIGDAMYFASRSDNPLVYEVTPIGELEDDPDFPTAGVSFACPKAKIIALYSIPPAVIQFCRQKMLNQR
jgi:hypothetical protein